MPCSSFFHLSACQPGQLFSPDQQPQQFAEYVKGDPGHGKGSLAHITPQKKASPGWAGPKDSPQKPAVPSPARSARWDGLPPVADAAADTDAESIGPPERRLPSGVPWGRGGLALGALLLTFVAGGLLQSHVRQVKKEEVEFELWGGPRFERWGRAAKVVSPQTVGPAA